MFDRSPERDTKANRPTGTTSAIFHAQGRFSAADLARAEWEGMVNTPDGEDTVASIRQMPTIHQIAQTMAERDCQVACVVDEGGRFVGMVTNLEIVHGPLAKASFQAKGDDSLRRTIHRLRERGLSRSGVVDGSFAHLAVLLDPQSSAEQSAGSPAVQDALAEISGHRTVWIRLP